MPNAVHFSRQNQPKDIPIPNPAHLNQGELVGSDVESIDVGGKAGVGLLGTVGADIHVSLAVFLQGFMEQW